MKCG